MRSVVVIVLAGGLLAACGEGSETSDARPARRLMAAQVETPTVSLTDAQMVQACAAATAANGRSDVTVEASSRSAPESVHLVFAKRSDGSQWTVQCRVDDDRLVWHVVEVEGGNDAQQLAEGAAAVMRYQVNGDAVQVVRAS